MGRSAAIASLLAAWTTLAAAAAFAQTAPSAEPPAAPAPASASAPATAGEPTTVQGVTVTARRPPVKDLPRAVSQFVLSHSAPSRWTEQVTRWGRPTPICIVTVGLDPGFNAFVTQRVQAVAASIGAPVATSKPGKPCAPNIEIIFAQHPQDLARLAFKRNSGLLGFHFAAETARLSEFAPPVKAWYATGTRDYDGQIQADAAWPTPTSLSDPMGGPRSYTVHDSRLRTGLSSEFTNILVIADTNAVAGSEIGSISDYMAMLVLSQPGSLTGCAPLASILDLFSINCSDEDKPKALTPADLAYLKALYKASGEQTLYVQRDDISDQMRRALTAAH